MALINIFFLFIFQSALVRMGVCLYLPIVNITTGIYAIATPIVPTWMET